ncbi:MAG TPA: cytochrome c biogenesis protein CcsA [Candidatus Binatia bacterium]|nr:cytochrome c biogenesis protein CcsA [Candidatus Binatia bacterium]
MDDSSRIWRDRILPGATGAFMVAAIAMVFLVVPSEREQGVVQRIFYFHVATAWICFAGFAIVAGASIRFLMTGSEGADRLAHASAEVSLLYTTLVLVVGPIWARPIWGVWWTWDPRLTMTVVLWTIYAAYLMLRRLGADDDAVRRYAAVLGVVGSLTIPFLFLAIRLWRGIHPAVMIAKDPDAGLKDPMMGWTLLVANVALALLFAWLVWLRTRLIRIDEQVAALALERARA